MPLPNFSAYLQDFFGLSHYLFTRSFIKARLKGLHPFKEPQRGEVYSKQLLSLLFEADATLGYLHCRPRLYFDSYRVLADAFNRSVDAAGSNYSVPSV